MYPLSPWRIVISNLFTKYRGIVRFTWPCFVKRLSEKINEIPVETTFCTPVVVSYSPSSHCKIPVDIIITSPSSKAAHNSNHQLILIVVFFPCRHILGGGFQIYTFYFHSDPWGNDPIWRAYFSDGWFNHQLVSYCWWFRNPTPVGMLNVPYFTKFYTSKWRSPDFWTINGITFDARGCFPTTNMPSP